MRLSDLLSSLKTKDISDQDPDELIKYRNKLKSVQEDLNTEISKVQKAILQKAPPDQLDALGGDHQGYPIFIGDLVSIWNPKPGQPSSGVAI
mmetsp:Transcript_18172/g.25669  ORF Transcript_18172/g.25669 Transcript_18172/m.25669 type:complete len:92 (+) Transcript_18172:522-797(+)